MNDTLLMSNIFKRNNVKVIGEGAQTLLFAHGFGCDQNTWRSVLAGFLDDYKLVVFDYVGSGCSDFEAYCPERYSTLDGYVQDVLEICVELKLTDVIFIGHSVSSMIGLRASLQAPSFFSKLVFICPSPRYINDNGYYGGMEQDDLDALLEVMDNNYLGWSRPISSAEKYSVEIPVLDQHFTENFCTTDPEISRKFAQVTFSSDSRAYLSMARIPSLTLQGRDDMLTSEKVARYIQQYTPENRLCLLDTAGHFPQLSDPRAVISAIKDFID